MALVGNAKYINDGASGSNGLSVLSAKAVQNRDKVAGSRILNYTKKFFGTPEERAELLPSDYRERVAELEAEGKSHTMASIIAGAKEEVERLGEVPNGANAVLDAIAGTPEKSNLGTTKSGTSSAKPIVYSDWTPAAQLFGMDQPTAYAEHMANTAHQREVADLRAAGLNPVLGLGSGASGVSGNVAISSTNGSAGYSSAKKGIDSSTVDALAATASVIATLVSKKPYLGNSIGNAIKQIGRAFSD